MKASLSQLVKPGVTMLLYAPPPCSDSLVHCDSCMLPAHTVPAPAPPTWIIAHTRQYWTEYRLVLRAYRACNAYTICILYAVL